jgi:hypothetical protein
LFGSTGKSAAVVAPVLDEQSYKVALKWEQGKIEQVKRIAGDAADAAAGRIGLGTKCRELADVYHGPWDATQDSADRHRVKVRHYVLTKERLAIEGGLVYSECSKRQLDFFLENCGPDTPVLNHMLMESLRGLDATSYLHEGSTKADGEANTALNSILPDRLGVVVKDVSRLDRLLSRKKDATRAKIEAQVQEVIASCLRECAPGPIAQLSIDKRDYYVMPDRLTDPNAYDGTLLVLLKQHALMSLYSLLSQDTLTFMESNFTYDSVSDWVDVHRGMWDALAGKAGSKMMGTYQEKMQGYFAKYLVSPEEFSSFIRDVQSTAQANIRQHANYYMTKAESPTFPMVGDGNTAGREAGEERGDATERFLSQLGPVPDLPTDKIGITFDILDATDTAMGIVVTVVGFTSTAAAPGTLGASLAAGAAVITVITVITIPFDMWYTEQVVVQAQESYQGTFGSKLILSYDDKAKAWRGIFLPCAEYTVENLLRLAPSATTTPGVASE